MGRLFLGECERRLDVREGMGFMAELTVINHSDTDPDRRILLFDVLFDSRSRARFGDVRGFGGSTDRLENAFADHKDTRSDCVRRIGEGAGRGLCDVFGGCDGWFHSTYLALNRKLSFRRHVPEKDACLTDPAHILAVQLGRNLGAVGFDRGTLSLEADLD